MKLQRTLTAEQIDIVRCHARHLEVHAFAGCGKTSVLDAYAAARPDKRILYLAYNTITAAEARRKFGRHVTCKTTHGLAWATHGKPFEHKLDNLRERHVMATLDVEPKVAHWVLKCVEAFLYSEHSALCEDHVPKGPSPSVRATVLARAEQLWAYMRDLRRLDVPMPHDGYLKLYALSKPNLAEKFDVILFDEAQDANPVTASLVRAQTGCTLVLVGDPHQAIYRFRGAVDALSKTDGATILPLTGSFRFGVEIGLIASTFLWLFKGERRVLRGCAPHTSDFLEIRSEHPLAVLCRTNATVFRNAFDALGEKRVYFVGGVDKYPFDKLLDVHLLACGQSPRDAFYGSFASVRELEVYARAVKDKESIGLVGLESAYGDDIPDLVNRVKAEAARRESEASLVLSTTHRAKGLEFRQVKVADNDFEPLLGEGNTLRSMDTEELIEEANLHYVAMTRATHALLPCIELALAMKPMVHEWRQREALNERSGHLRLTHKSSPAAPAPPRDCRDVGVRRPAIQHHV